MSAASYWPRIQVLREKQTLIFKFVYDHSLKIERALELMEEADTEDAKKRQLEIAMDSAREIRAYIEEMK